MTVILWDFDGTIADTMETIIRIGNRLAVEFGIPPASPSEIERLKHLTARQIIRQSGIPLLKLPFLLRRLRLELNREILQVDPIEGITPVLRELAQRGYTLGILTSNSEANVRAFLEQHQLLPLFQVLHCGTSVWGKSRILRRLIQQQGWTPEQMVYIGDETRDIEAAREVPMRVISVSWGFNSHQALIRYSPDYLVDHPPQILDVLEQWFPHLLPVLDSNP